MDDQTLESLAELICGDDAGRGDAPADRFSPTYRKGYQLTQFFERAGLPRLRHDGSTRKWWTLEALRSCSADELEKVILRLANPREYGGNQQDTAIALRSVNELLRLEGKRVRLNGVVPLLEDAPVTFTLDERARSQDLRPLPPPDFMTLGLEPGIGELLSQRWAESQRCVEAGAHLAAIIMMGSLLEGMLVAVIQRNPEGASNASCAPRDRTTGKPRPYPEWKLGQMIDVAHELRWLDLDVKRFSHSLREFRNLVHPYQQLLAGVSPDEDTAKISWLVVQAATNDLAKVIQAPKREAV